MGHPRCSCCCRSIDWAVLTRQAYLKLLEQTHEGSSLVPLLRHVGGRLSQLVPRPIPDGSLAWLPTFVAAAAGAQASIQTPGSALQSQHSGLQTQGSGAVPLHQQQAVLASANLSQRPVHLQSTPQAPSEPAPLQAGPAQQQLASPQMATSLASSAAPAHTQAAGPPSVVLGAPSAAPRDVPAAPVGAAGAVPPAQAAGLLPGAVPSGGAGAQQPVGQPVGPLQPQLQQQHQQQTQGPGETRPKGAGWQPVSTPASNGNTVNAATILQQQQGMHRPAAPGKGPAVHRNVHGDMTRRLALAVAAAATRMRQRQKAESLRRAEDATAVRAEPLGQDRRFNR